MRKRAERTWCIGIGPVHTPMHMAKSMTVYVGFTGLFNAILIQSKLLFRCGLNLWSPIEVFFDRYPISRSLKRR